MLSLSDWITTLSLVFGGCCSNAITLERITSENPHSGVLVTFFQFFIVSLYALPSQFTFSIPVKAIKTNGLTDSTKKANGGHERLHSIIPTRTTWLPRLRKRRVPFLPYIIQVALFFALSTLNNAAFAYDIPMSVHIVFRSGGMIINMALGWLLVKKRYTPRQVVSVLVVTIGIVLTTLSASKSKSRASSPQTTDVSLYAQGISILSLALLLSGFLGLIQDWVFARYFKPTEAQAVSDPLTQPSWQESMFYIHSLALPLFYFSKDSITTELMRMSASPPISLSSSPLVEVWLSKGLDNFSLPLPSMLFYLFLNTATQLFCVIGVNRLTGRVTSLTVTLILTVRKAVSLLLSVAVYGGQGNAKMWAGAALVFLGTIGYSTGSRAKRVEQAKDKKD
ncbi:UAA transporter [Paxillus ammoniavirescens]|nr:UAA transporter [Paxillus ammoniavirescens]